jgi:hypothetical protein
MILADRSTVVAMAAAGGMAERWRRACWFFSGAAWDAGELGLGVARLVVKYLTGDGEPLVVAVDGTLFRRWGKKVFQARWAYDGAAQGGKKVASGNTWVIAAIVCRLLFCSSPVALPVLFRLWRGKGTASQVELAAEMLGKLAAAFPGRQVHGTGDAAFHGESLAVAGTTWTTRLPANAVLYGPEPPRTGQRGRPRVKGDRLGTCAQIAAQATWTDTVINVYGHGTAVQIAAAGGLWHGSFKTAPGRIVLVRDPGSPSAYDLGLFTLDTNASPAAIAERYSWRWPIEMVFTQLAKRAVRLVGGRGEHVADLDLAVGDDDAVDEQLGQLPPLLEGGGGEPGADGLAECLDAVGDGLQFQPLAGGGVQLPLLGRQGSVAAVQLVPLALKFGQGDDLGQVGIEQPLLLAVQLA